MPLLLAISQTLERHPGLTAREIQAALDGAGQRDVDRSSINRVLYSDPGRFVSDGGWIPRWSLATSEFTPGSRPHIPVPDAGQADGAGGSRAFPRVDIPLRPWQREALECWRRAGHRGVIEAVTGTGKTFVGIAAAVDEVRDGGKALVIVPTIELQRQWASEVANLWPDARLGFLGGGERSMLADVDILIAVVNSVRSESAIAWEHVTLIVADECHRYGSAFNLQALDVRVARRLGLTATFERSDGGHEGDLGERLGGVCYAMDLERSIEDGYIARFAIALVGVDFTVEERTRYVIADAKARRIRRKLVDEFNVPANPFEAFARALANLARGGEGAATALARAYQSAQSERRQLLAASSAKLDMLIDLAPAIQSARRALVFTQSKRAAEDAAEVLQGTGIQIDALHSGTRMRERAEILDRFKQGTLAALAAPQILDEGVDVPAADLAVVVAAFQSRRQMIQRLGRILRRSDRPDKLARLVLLFVRETSEDPSRGAHEDFLVEVTNVADHVALFDSGDAAGVNAFLAHTSVAQPPRDYPRYVKPIAPNSGESVGSAPYRSMVMPLPPLTGARPLPPLMRSGVPFRCPYCAASVRGRLTGAETIGFFQDQAPDQPHSCPGASISLVDVPMEHAPRAVWAAVMRLRSERTAIPIHRVREAEHDAPERDTQAQEVERPPEAPPPVAVERIVEIASALAALNASTDLSGSAMHAGLQLWSSLQQHLDLNRDPVYGPAIARLRRELIAARLIDRPSRIVAREGVLDRAPTAPSAAGVARPVAQPPAPPLRERDWGQCASCGAPIAGCSISDVCARCRG